MSLSSKTINTAPLLFTPLGMMKECEHFAGQMGFVRSTMTIFIFHQGVFCVSNTTVHLFLHLCDPYCAVPVGQSLKIHHYI